MDVLESDNIEEFDKLYDPSLAPIQPNTVVSIRNVVEGGKVIASGLVKPFIELVIAVDKTIPKISKIRAIDKLLSEAIIWCDEHGVEYAHALVADRNFGRFLCKRYGFIYCKDVTLVLKVGGKTSG